MLKSLISSVIGHPTENSSAAVLTIIACSTFTHLSRKALILLVFFTVVWQSLTLVNCRNQSHSSNTLSANYHKHFSLSALKSWCFSAVGRTKEHLLKLNEILIFTIFWFHCFMQKRFGRYQTRITRGSTLKYCIFADFFLTEQMWGQIEDGYRSGGFGSALFRSICSQTSFCWGQIQHCEVSETYLNITPSHRLHGAVRVHLKLEYRKVLN